MIRPPRAIGRRGTCLVFFAVLDLVYGLSLWRPAPAAAQAPATRLLAAIMPLSWWGALWFVVGVVCLVGAFVHRADRVAFAAAAGIKTLWGTVFLFGWIGAGLERGWVASVVWLAFAAFVMVLAGWPEPVTVTADLTDNHTQ